MTKTLRVLFIVLATVGIVAFAVVGPIDRTPLEDQPFYQHTIAKLDDLPTQAMPEGPIQAAWGKVSITPDHSMPMAGYKPRDGFAAIRDTLYARMLWLENARQKSVLLNVDLLLFPPLLKEKIQSRMAALGMTDVFLYLSATHTHNGIGGWDDSVLGHVVLGDFDEGWIELMADRIVNQMQLLRPVPATVNYWEVDASEWIENRIAFDKGEKDGRLRGLVIKRADEKQALFFTYSAHATSIPKEVRELSADYPAAVIRLAEQQFDFGMYMAGMVGSHRFVWFSEPDGEYIPKVAGLIYDRIGSRTNDQVFDRAALRVRHIPIEFGPSQMRIAKDWKVRDWVFRSLVNPLKGEMTILEIGNIVMIGTPCDFSGEIYVRNGLQQLAESTGKHIIITSFNGDYNGYITYDPHYETLSKDEVRTMNWVGPHFGTYFTRVLEHIIAEE